MISVHELLARVRIDQRLLDSWVGESWLVPYLGSEPQFTDLDVARARLIRELKELGVNDQGIGLILHLLDQVHGLRRQMHALMERCASDLMREGTP
jgi:chaperone modulatory protein CbpM